MWKNEKVFLEDLADVNHDLEKMQTRKPNDKDKRADSSRGTPRELTKQDQQRLLQVHILSPQEFAGRFEGLRRSVAKEKAKVKPQDIQNAIFREMLKSCRKGFCAVTAGDEGYVDAEEFSAYAADHPEILIPIVQLRRLVDDEILSGSCPANYRERRKKRSTGPPGYDLNADYKVFDLENLEKSIESIKRKKEREAEKKRQMHNRTVGNLGGTASLTPDPMGPNRGPGTLDRASKKMAKFAGGLLKKDKPSKGKEEED